jgi:hypothetical protein
MDKILTADVVKKLGVKPRVAQNWAAKNGVEAILGSNKVVLYLWTEEDIARFLVRPKPGKRAKKKPLAFIESEKKDEKPEKII